ncbi:hypothetical protein PIB30_015678 [Stylosanthes scabra]|uniref:Uncharacterized protein n=1 Tax=Stylosanthes scabra TaxID=79078 RepID=A0ABU6U675_9FABA|nr:hypothetical protein [Stylosanthes scabra]
MGSHPSVISVVSVCTCEGFRPHLTANVPASVIIHHVDTPAKLTRRWTHCGTTIVALQGLPSTRTWNTSGSNRAVTIPDTHVEVENVSNNVDEHAQTTRGVTRTCPRNKMLELPALSAFACDDGYSFARRKIFHYDADDKLRTTGALGGQGRSDVACMQPVSHPLHSPGPWRCHIRCHPMYECLLRRVAFITLIFIKALSSSALTDEPSRHVPSSLVREHDWPTLIMLTPEDSASALRTMGPSVHAACPPRGWGSSVPQLMRNARSVPWLMMESALLVTCDPCVYMTPQPCHMFAADRTDAQLKRIVASVTGNSPYVPLGLAICVSANPEPVYQIAAAYKRAPPWTMPTGSDRGQHRIQVTAAALASTKLVTHLTLNNGRQMATVVVSVLYYLSPYPANVWFLIRRSVSQLPSGMNCCHSAQGECDALSVHPAMSLRSLCSVFKKGLGQGTTTACRMSGRNFVHISTLNVTTFASSRFYPRS